MKTQTGPQSPSRKYLPSVERVKGGKRNNGVNGNLNGKSKRDNQGMIITAADGRMTFPASRLNRRSGESARAGLAERGKDARNANSTIAVGVVNETQLHAKGSSLGHCPTKVTSGLDMVIPHSSTDTFASQPRSKPSRLRRLSRSLSRVHRISCRES